LLRPRYERLTLFCYNQETRFLNTHSSGLWCTSISWAAHTAGTTSRSCGSRAGFGASATTDRCGPFPITTFRLCDCPYWYQKGLLPLPWLFVHTSRYTRLTFISTISGNQNHGEGSAGAKGVPFLLREGRRAGRGKYFPFTTFRRLIAHTRLTFIYFQSGSGENFGATATHGRVTRA
jgi:hypothetical protein